MEQQNPYKHLDDQMAHKQQCGMLRQKRQKWGEKKS